MDQECVSLSFDRTELESSEQTLTRTFSTELTPSPEVIAALTLIQRPVQDYSYNKNHPVVSPSLLKSLEPTIQLRINLLNTRMTSRAKDCSDRQSYEELIRHHMQSIQSLGSHVKKLVVAGLKEEMTKEELELIRFAVSKRFTVWRKSLEVVRKRPGSWEQRDELWKRLILANRMSWSAYHLKTSLRLQ